ncbi:hypothetical protein CYJ10_33095 [Cupriavidus pauculus]|uniref:Uncharacterized protein n=1 Tax=Cupriavidus pauculus TaxID=82633 RepID=A0A2N5C232_9BURK|nr:hypothetical protein CYJ10_33095 [Cupriavidus pauculus]
MHDVSMHPASDFQIRRAYALCIGSPRLQRSLEEFLQSGPDRCEMDAYLKRLKSDMAASLVSALVGNLSAS